MCCPTVRSKAIPGLVQSPVEAANQRGPHQPTAPCPALREDSRVGFGFSLTFGGGFPGVQHCEAIWLFVLISFELLLKSVKKSYILNQGWLRYTHLYSEIHLFGWEVLWVLTNVYSHVTTTKTQIQKSSKLHICVLCGQLLSTAPVSHTADLFCLGRIRPYLDFEPGSLNLPWCIWNSSMLLCISIACSFLLLSSTPLYKITADVDCRNEIKRHLFLGRKVMTNLDSILKSRDITLPAKVQSKLWFFQ